MRCLLISFLTVTAFGHIAWGHSGCHHGNCGDCAGDHRCYGCASSSRADRWSGPAVSGAERQPAVVNVETREGRIAEVVYLPGATPDSSMVELRLMSGSNTASVRLGPAGFLKQGQLGLKEGDSVAVSGFWVSSDDGQLLVATEIGKQGKTLQLRDRRGRPIW